MKIRLLAGFGLALSALIVVQHCLFGCKRAEETEKSAEGEGISSNDLSKVEFAVVDGVPVTAAEIQKSVEIAVRFNALRTRRPAKPFGRWSNVLAMQITPGYVYGIAYDQELHRRGIEPTPGSDAMTLAHYNEKLRSQHRDLNALASVFGNLADAFKAQFRRESRLRALYAQTPKLKVSEEDIVRFYSSLSNRVARCQEIDQAAKVKINDAWRELQSGRDWNDVATNYTEDALLEITYKDNWKDWVSLDLMKIEPPELAVLLREMKPGEYTKPFQHDEGLIIVRVNEREGNFFGLSRILVRSALEIAIPDRDDAVKQLEREKIGNFQKGEIEALKQKVKIEYPLGTRFYYKIWDEPQQDKRKKSK